MEERENIRERLRKHSLSYVWLISQLRMRGIVTDKTEMSSVISGVRTGQKPTQSSRLPTIFWTVTNRVLSSLVRSNVSENGRKCFGFPACEKG